MSVFTALASLGMGLQCTASPATGDQLYVRHGQFVSAEGTRLNLYCMGAGTPAVVFDSGWEDWALVALIR